TACRREQQNKCWTRVGLIYADFSVIMTFKSAKTSVGETPALRTSAYKIFLSNSLLASLYALTKVGE
ncbi:MAG: hypothetical protein KDE46_22835, partial [Caldilineaceae bacterium]|nr:hypothetical protein [Caldilineaceae bacterium]